MSQFVYTKLTPSLLFIYYIFFPYKQSFSLRTLKFKYSGTLIRILSLNFYNKKIYKNLHYLYYIILIINQIFFHDRSVLHLNFILALFLFCNLNKVLKNLIIFKLNDQKKISQKKKKNFNLLDSEGDVDKMPD